VQDLLGLNILIKNINEKKTTVSSIELEAMDLKALFGRRQEAILGMDISAWGIKVVGLSGSMEQPVLEQLASIRLPSGHVVDGHIVKMHQVAQALRYLLQENRISAQKVALALPSSAVITKKIMVQADLNPEDMQAQVEEEAQHYIPFALDEVSLDFCTLGPNPQRAQMVDVLIAAARRDRVQSLEELVELAELEASAVDVQSYALRLATRRLVDIHLPAQKNAVVLLLKVGAGRTLMQVTVGEAIVYEHDLALGGDQLTQRIAAHYRLSDDEAETKKISGAWPQDFESSVLLPYVYATAQLLERGMQFIANNTPYSRVSQIFLSGGGAMLPGLAAAISTALQSPCTLINPFEGMRLAPQVRDKPCLQNAPLFIGACGLALRRFSL
jgi:type IV pilus assembly protein PilM